MLLLVACSDPSTEIHTGRPKIPEVVEETALDSAAPADPCAEDVAEPDDATFPATIDTLTVTIRTGDGLTDGTDDTGILLCLSETACQALSPGDGNPLDAGETGVWSFTGLGLPRSAVDRVELRETVGENHWSPACVDLRFDGEPVYCNEVELDLGNGSGEEMSWVDPEGLHSACVSCDGATITHGPFVGAVTSADASIWLRADASRKVGLRVGTLPDLSDGRITDWVFPAAADDFTAVLRADCLLPDTAYYYEVLVEDPASKSGAGSFRTPPEDGTPAAWRMAFGSCAKDEDQPIFATIDSSAPALFAFVGDNHYGDTTDLDLARWYYRWSLERPERAAFLQHTPTLAIWDDHDFGGNDVQGDTPGKQESLQAFSEYWANPAYGSEATPGVYFVSRWGDVDLFFLDDRYYRGLDGSALGQPQHDWLVEALESSTATFKLVADGSQWSLEGGGDSWADYPDERAELFEVFERVPGVVLLSGDIHRSELRELQNEAGYPLPELISSPLANIGLFCGGDDELIACYDGGNSFIVIDFDTAQADPTLRATIIDEAGAEQGSATWSLSQLQ